MPARTRLAPLALCAAVALGACTDATTAPGAPPSRSPRLAAAGATGEVAVTDVRDLGSPVAGEPHQFLDLVGIADGGLVGAVAYNSVTRVDAPFVGSDGGFRRLALPPVPYNYQPRVEFTALNGSGVGTGHLPGDRPAGASLRAARFTADGAAFLPDGPVPDGLGPVVASLASGINDAGDVVGDRVFGGASGRATVWRAGGEVVDLGLVENDVRSQALGVNERGQVVGFTATRGGVERPVLFADGRATVLALPPGLYIGRAVAINERGEIAGYGAAEPLGSTRAVLWNAAGQPTLLGDPAEGQPDFSRADALNDVGDVLGRVSTVSGGQRVVRVALWRDGVLSYLPAGPGVAVSSESITNDRQVAVRREFGAGDRTTVERWTLGATAGSPALLVDGNSGRCLDVLGESREPGAGLIIYDCHGGANQRFSYPAAGQTGEIRVYAGEGTPLCVDAWGAGTENGTRLVVWTCHGGANQQWTRTADGAFRGLQSGRCVDVLGARTENLTDVWLWDCFGGANQRWDARAPSQTVVSAGQ